MTEIDSCFLDANSYVAKYLRMLARHISTEGIVTSGALEVTEKGTPNMSVNVAAGWGFVQGDQSTAQGHYQIYNDATVNKAIGASDPTNPRKDRIIAQIKDSTDISGAVDEWELQVLTGTPAASPSAPALPDDALDLALIAVAAAATTIVNANITDQRNRIKIQNIDEPTSDYEGANKKYVDENAGSASGWLSADETWTYASADDPTFTFTISGDKTGKYSVGMKIKLTQTTVKYFIITKIAYSSPNTTVTVYGGTDYDLVNAAITNNYYSYSKAPLDFPLDPDKWTVEVSDTGVRSQANAVQNTWYNLGSITISIPIGAWRTRYVVYIKSSLALKDLRATLSTANNSESDVDFTTAFYPAVNYGGMVVISEKILNLVAKTSYYINTRTITAGAPTIENANSANKLFIRAICSYL